MRSPSPVRLGPRRAALGAASVLLGASAVIGGTHPERAHAAAMPARLYAADYGSNTVTGYAPDASGNVAPVISLSGAATGLSSPCGVAFDAYGTLYVSDAANGNVTEYAATATGNTAPLRTITGTASYGGNGSCGLAVDTSNVLYVSSPLTNAINEYALGASGAATPLRSITGAATLLSGPQQVAFDSGGNLYVAGANGITVYAPGVSGNVAPIRQITGAATALSTPAGLTVDGGGNIYVGNNGNSTVTVYAAGANGNIAPTRTLSGAATTLSDVNALVTDTSGTLYVSDGTPNYITEYSSGATGNTAPSTTISGAATALSNANGLVLYAGVAGQPIVATVGAGTLTIAAPASLSLGSLTPGVATGAMNLGALSFTNTLNDGSSWSVALTATGLWNGTTLIPFNNDTITVGGTITGSTGYVGLPTAGSSGSFSGTDSTSATVSSSITLVSGAAANADEGTYTQTGNQLNVVVPGNATTGAYSATFTYTITG